MTNKEKRAWIGLGLFTVLMVLNYIFIFNFQSLNLYYRVIRPIVCVGLVVFFVRQKKPIVEVSLKHRYILIVLVLVVSIIYLMTYFMLGFLDGFGKNPFNTSPKGIFYNMITFIPFYVALEFFRSFFIHSFPKKRRLLIMGVVVLMFTLFTFTMNQYEAVLTNNLEANVIFFGSKFVPELSKNILLVNLSLMGGVWMSFIAKFAFEGMIFFFPVLPNLKWITIALLNNLYPVLSLTFVKNALFSKDNRDRRPRALDHTFSWTLTYLSAICVVWFAVGLFPVFPTVILTGSMEPEIYPGDVAVMQKVDKEDIEIGDIIQFWAEDYFIIHRVVAIENDKYITKGDNNNTQDSKPVDYGQIKGRLITKVKYIGKPTLLLRTSTNGTLEEAVKSNYDLGRDKENE